MIFAKNIESFCKVTKKLPLKNLKLKKPPRKLKQKPQNSSKKLRVREAIASFLCPSDVKKNAWLKATLIAIRGHPSSKTKKNNFTKRWLKYPCQCSKHCSKFKLRICWTFVVAWPVYSTYQGPSHVVFQILELGKIEISRIFMDFRALLWGFFVWNPSHGESCREWHILRKAPRVLSPPAGTL